MGWMMVAHHISKRATSSAHQYPIMLMCRVVTDVFIYSVVLMCYKLILLILILIMVVFNILSICILH